MSGQRDIAPSPVAGVVSISPFRRDFKSNVIVLLAIPYFFCRRAKFYRDVSKMINKFATEPDG